MNYKTEIKEKIVNILKQKAVKRASFFGSIVKGEFKQESDIDLVIEFMDKENKSLLDLIDLKQELEELLNKQVDILTFDSINPRLKDAILNNQEPIYG